MYRHQLQFETPGRGTRDITPEIQQVVADSGIVAGMCHLFCRHTSASLILCENADPQVRRDLEAFMGGLVPDGDPMFLHDAEGPDDMPAHVRSVLTQAGLSLPVEGGRCDLGTWQGVFLYEHRTAAHRRNVTVSVWGEG
jgi:secondary thiamine-phosphate synthase enzyme